MSPHPHSVRFHEHPEGGAGSRRGGTAAFTLLEVLLATAIAAVVLLAVQAVFGSALTLRSRTVAAIETALPVERALEQLRRDLANMAPPGGTLSGALQTAPTGSVVLAGQVGPQFTTQTGVVRDNEPWPEWQQVSYLLLKPTNNTPGLQWFRSVTRNLLSRDTEIPERQWMLDGVEDLQFLFHDGTQWVNTWDSSLETSPMPLAVKVTLLMAAPERGAEPPPPIEIVVPYLVLTPTVTNSTSTTSTSTATP